MSGADDGVALPVSQTGFARDNGRTLGNVNSIRDQAASGVLAGTSVITFSASPKTAPQVAAIAFVIPDHLVDAFMAQLDALFAQPAADLLRRPAHLAQLRLDLTARRYRELAGLTSYRLPCLSLGFRLLEPIAALTTIAVNLPAHRALTDAQNFGDAFLARPTLAQRINLAAILILYRRYLLIGNLLQSQEVTPSSHHSIMRWLLESAHMLKNSKMELKQKFATDSSRPECLVVGPQSAPVGSQRGHVGPHIIFP